MNQGTVLQDASKQSTQVIYNRAKIWEIALFSLSNTASN
ncbi:MAG: hypothetical protein K0R78_3317, partial [Pelosinus sp.]|nr:hypothetical protein [Pelosinus sp.]